MLTKLRKRKGQNGLCFLCHCFQHKDTIQQNSSNSQKWRKNASFWPVSASFFTSENRYPDFKEESSKMGGLKTTQTMMYKKSDCIVNVYYDTAPINLFLHYLIRSAERTNCSSWLIFRYAIYSKIIATKGITNAAANDDVAANDLPFTHKYKKNTG